MRYLQLLHAFLLICKLLPLPLEPVAPAHRKFAPRVFRFVRSIGLRIRFGTLRTQLEAIVSIDPPVSRPRLAKAAHTIVSQAGSLGFIRLSRLSSELEEACMHCTDYTDLLGRVKRASHSALSTIDRLQEKETLVVDVMEADRK